MRNLNTRGRGGFTLIEVMITVAIVAILAAIAYPSYTEYVLRSNRADAKAALLEDAQFLERNYTETSPPTYATDTAGNAVTLPITQSPRSGTALYTLSATTLTATTFTLTAAPVAGGRMAGDKCASFTLNNFGQKALSGTPTATVQDCWAR
ncbi:type IV pilin protein [Thiocystis violacea]|uniref:type IV pilin protein n=1 Tax=Thiocystis violacea TaxID=13725 RepID=UPI001906534B|nr:type IV pilin protein [Thiocystis violacea]MBK1723733.1 hypothetical protein [Thiocystis violacea]